MSWSASPSFRVELPSSTEVALAHEEYLRVEGRDVMYRVARDLVEQAYGGHARFSVGEGVAVLLLSWNAAFYRPRPALVRTLVHDLEALIDTHASSIEHFRARVVETYEQKTDSRPVEKLYRSFVDRLWPVGAAKALHVLAPRFFPLWDNAIAQRFRLRLSPRESSIQSYVDLIEIGHRFAIAAHLDNPLKALDEWAYVRFTVARRR
jgi:hypothetical protein